MSLLKKASIITTPTAYAEDYLYSIKPAYALGSELVTNGGFSNGTNNWTPNANATLSVENGRLKVAISGAGSGYPSQDITTEVGKKYRITANAFIGTSTKVSLYSVVFGFNDLLVDGSYDLTFKATSTTTQIRLYVYGDGTYGFWDNVSVKEVTDADFDFDRNSTGTRVNEDYLIEDVPYNLASYSENISVWDNFRVDVELSNVLNPFKSGYVYLVDDGTLTDNHYRKKSYIYLDSSYTYTQSFFVKKKDDGVYPVLRTSGVGGNSFVTFNWDTETLVQGSDITSSKVEKYNYGWYRISMVFSNLATTDFIIGISNDVNDDLPTYTGSNKGFYVWGCQIVKGDQPKDYLKTTDRLDIPRIDYTNGEPSILLEPSRSNLIIYSQDYSQWTSSLSPTVTSNFAISPEGVNNADKITASSNTSSKYIGITLATSTVYTGSVFLKNIDSTQTRLEVYAGSWAYPNFEISWNGYIPSTLSSNNVSNIQYQEYTNNWWRVSYQFTTDSSITSYNTYIYPDRVNASKSILAFGSQLEAGSYPTSLIHTSGSAVTRSADAANNAGNSDLINSTEGVLYAEIKVDTQTAFGPSCISINDGSDSNRITLLFYRSSNLLRAFMKKGGVTQFDMQESSLPKREYFIKVAVKYKANDCSLWFNGVRLLTDTSAVMPDINTLTKLDFNLDGSLYPFYGNAKSVMVFKEALTDLELEKLTGYNNHELYMNYYNRLSYLGLAEEYNVESDINNYIL